MNIQIKFNAKKIDGLTAKVVEDIETINEYAGFIWFGKEGKVLYAVRNEFVDELEQVE